MAMRSKVGVVKDGFMPGKPKKTRQGQGKTPSTPRLLAIIRRRFIAGRANEHIDHEPSNTEGMGT